MKISLRVFIGWILLVGMIEDILSKLDYTFKTSKRVTDDNVNVLITDIVDLVSNFSIVIVTDEAGPLPDPKNDIIEDPEARAYFLTTRAYLTTFLPQQFSMKPWLHLKAVNIEAKRKSFYIILMEDREMQNELMTLIERIRFYNYDSRIAVIYTMSIDVKEHYEGFGIYNLYIFVVKDKDDELFEVYDVCQFCDKGRDKVENINIWKSQIGFANPMVFRKSFRGNYHGADLTIASLYSIPNLHPIGEDENGGVILDGEVYRGYQMLAKVLNASLKILNHPPPYNYNPWMYVQDVRSGRADIVGGGWSCASIFYLYTGDISSSYAHKDGTKIISIEPLKGARVWQAFITPFGKAIWFYLIISIPGGAMVLYLSRKYSRVPDKKASFWDCIWDIIIILLWDGVRCPHPSWPIIINLSAYLMSYYILVTFYLGDYAAHLVPPHYLTPPIDTLDQLWNNPDIKWVTSDDSQKWGLLSYLGHMPNWKERNVLAHPTNGSDEPHYVTGLRKVAENPNSMVYFLPEENAQYFIDEYELTPKGRKFHFSKESFKSISSCDYFKQNFYAKDDVNKNILLRQAMGMDYMINRDYNAPTWKKAAKKEAKETEGQTLEDRLDLVKIEHFSAGVGLALGLYGACILTLIIEIVYYYVILIIDKRQGKKFRNDVESNDQDEPNEKENEDQDQIREPHKTEKEPKEQKESEEKSEESNELGQTEDTSTKHAKNEDTPNEHGKTEQKVKQNDEEDIIELINLEEKTEKNEDEIKVKSSMIAWENEKIPEKKDNLNINVHE